MPLWQTTRSLMPNKYLKLPVVVAICSMCTVVFAQAQNEVVSDVETTTPSPSRFGAPEVDAAYGAFQRGLYITARNLALPRAEAGDGAAMTLLAEIYARGLGVPIDREKSRDYYEQAAAQGVTEAEFRLGVLKLRDVNDRDDQQTAADLLRRAADKGHPAAQFNYGQLVRTLRPGVGGAREAVRYFKLAAEAGVADAQYLLGRSYLDGTLQFEPDMMEARVWFEKAARQNFTDAQVEYGIMLVDGLGGPKDVARGFGWTLQAARAGSAQGQLTVSQLYRAGIGVEPNNIEAAAWYVLARRADLRVPVMEDFWLGLSDEQQREAIARANALF
ncbi:MAG: tetratricopeptide repeat protein [Pseudomonadota bacterium]